MDRDEEWNNFMHKVTEITDIVHGLASEDKEKAERASALAEKYLNEKAGVETDDNLDIRLKCDKTMINKRSEPEKDDMKANNPNEMDAETFVKTVERDSQRRAEDRRVRQERAETFKTRAARAFRRGDFELALSCYNKAVDQVKDSCLLYTNRALTNIKLRNYDKVFESVLGKLACAWERMRAMIRNGLKDETVLGVIKEIFHCLLMKLFRVGLRVVPVSPGVTVMLQGLYLVLIQYAFGIIIRVFTTDDDGSQQGNEYADIILDHEA